MVKKTFSILLFFLLIVANAYSMSYVYIKPKQIFDSDVMLRKYGQKIKDEVDFSNFVNVFDYKVNNIYVHFAGKGREIYQLYGHTGIVVEFADNNRVFFDWGVFDSSEKGFLNNFIHGNMFYSLSVHRIDSFERYLKDEVRKSRYYKLDLTERQKKDIVQYLFFNSLDENVHYVYNFFLDNCSTRLRDLINVVLDDGLKKKYSNQKCDTYRNVLERAIVDKPLVEFIFNLGQGSLQDKTISYYEAMFLPEYLEACLKDFTIEKIVLANGGEQLIFETLNKSFEFLKFIPEFNDCFRSKEDGVIKKKISVDFMTLDSYERYIPKYPKTVIKGYNLNPQTYYINVSLSLLALLSAICVVLGKFVRREINMVPLFCFGVIDFIFGFISLLIIYFSSFTIHTFMYWNYNLLFVNPLLFITSFWTIRYAFNEKYSNKAFYSRLLMLLLCFVAMITKVFYSQENLYLILSFMLYHILVLAFLFCKNTNDTIKSLYGFAKKFNAIRRILWNIRKSETIT